MKKFFTKKKIISYFLEFIFFAAIFTAMVFWQQKDMLDSDVKAPMFKLKSLDGEVYSLGNSLGKKVILYFFAPWCKVCHYSMDNIVNLRKDVSKKDLDIYIIGLSYSKPEDVAAFAKDHNVNVPVLLGTSNTGDLYKVNSFPSIYVIDEKGMIQSKAIGYTTETGIKLRTLF